MIVISLTRSLAVPVFSPSVENVMLESLLLSCESLITYRRRYRSYLQLATVLDLILFDNSNPRSLLFQLERMQEHVDKLPQDPMNSHMSALERLVLESSTQLRLSDTQYLIDMENTAGTRQNLDQLLSRMSHSLSQMYEVITETYFRSLQVPHQLVSSNQEISDE